MESQLATLFLDHANKKLEQQTARILTCLEKLSEDQIWARGAEHENAIGNLVLHLCGNVRQWILVGVGEQLCDRDRDAEFAARGHGTIAELSLKLRTTVEQARNVIATQTSASLLQRLTVQDYKGSRLDAIFHVLLHFSEHTGQIQFITKALTGQDLGFYAHLNKPNHGETTP